MNEVYTDQEKKKEQNSEIKDNCYVIETLESLLTAVKPTRKEGFQETTIWMPALSVESQKEIEQKIIQFVRKLQ